MRTIGKRIQSLTRRGTWIALLFLVGCGLVATSASAQTKNVVVNQTIPLAALSSNGLGTGTAGGWGGSSTPTGETFVVDSHGNAIVGTNWAESLLAVNTTTGAATVLISGYNNVGPVALDTAGNLYVGNTYSSNIYKIPYITGTGYAAVSGSALPTTVCAGAVNTTTDTAACQFALNLQDTTGYYGIAAMAVDPSGNFWIATNQWPGEATNGKAINNTLLMCNTACQTGAQYADAPLVVYTDATATDELGEFAFDPWGNLFFTQASFSGGVPTTSGLWEISPVSTNVYTSPSGVVSYSNSQTYTNDLGGVAIDPISGTVYFTTNADGVFAIPNSQSNGPNTTATYTVSLIGGKGLALDSSDNLYQIAYSSTFFSSGGDTVERISVGDATTPITGAGQTMDVPLTAIDNGGSCSGGTPSTLSFDITGTNSSQFKASVTAPTAPATTSCNAPTFGSASPALPATVSFPVTLAYTPTGEGTSTATMAVTDSVTSATGSATLTGISEKAQTISFSTSLTWTYSSGLTITLQATGGKSGNPIVFALISGPATLESDGTTLDVSAPGTIVVTANEAGNATYAAAPQLTENIVVSPIPQTISWAPAPPRNVTTAATPITLTATGGASGNPVTFTIDASSTGYVSAASAAAGSLSGTNNDTLTFSGTAGVIVIDANQTGNTDYAAAPQVQATIVVTPSLLVTGPPVILSESTYLGELTGGGATSSSDPNGGTMAIDPNGDAIIGTTYGSSVLSFNLSNTNPGHQTEIAADTGNPSAVAVDANGNLFVGDTYGGAPYVYKIPWVSGAYATVSAKPTADCTGTDSTPCLMANVTAGSTYPIQSLAFDKQGDLFYGIQVDSGGAGTTGITDQASIWECDANCLYAGTDAPVMIFQEPAAGVTPLSGGTSVQLITGSLAVDPSGNVFFTDAAIDSQSLIHYSDLNELVINSSTTFPIPAATVLVTNIPSSPGEYVGEIDAVSIDPTSGTAYFSDQGAVYAFPNNGSALSPTNVQATMYTVSAQGGKYIALGANGNLYQSNYEGLVSKDSIWLTTLGAVSVLGSINDGSSATVPDTSNCIGSGGVWAACASGGTSVNAMYTVLNDGNCTNPETVTFAATDAQFTAALTTTGTPPAATCSGTFTDGSWFPTTLTFSPVSPSSGVVSETLTATDSNSNTGTATVSGTAVALTPQTISGFSGITSPVIYGSGPYTLSATASSGLAVTFSVDSTSTTGVATITGTTLTITGTGTLYIDVSQAGNSTYQPVTAKEGPITVSAAPQNIVFGAPLSDTSSGSPYQVGYGAAPITLTAADSDLSGAGSGNAITFTLDSKTTAGAATLTNGVLTITGLGTVVVDANQAASTNGDYAVAAQVQAFISVVQGTQAITLTPSATTAVYPATISFTATGGGSGNPVTLSIVSGGAIAMLSGNTLTPTGAAYGSVTVAANQLGNTDYGAAPQVTSTVTFTAIGTVATPTFSPASGSTLVVGTSNTVTISDTTANATIYYTTDGSTPTTASTVYSAPFTLTTTGSVTVNALAVETGYNASTATANYTVTTVPPNFTATATPTGAVLGPGQSQAFFIGMTPTGGFTGTVSFSCSGAPSGVTCSFNPATVTSDGTDEFSTTLTVTNGSSSAALRHDSIPFIPGGATFAVALCFLGWKRRRNLVLGLVLMAGILGLAQLTGCGGGSGPKQTTSTMTVTATSTVNGTTITQTIPLTITIQQ